MFPCYVLLLALLASAQGRAVNISNTWVLPEEGFPVFYRYFRDRISWYEADAVCQFHHANLVTVDTTAQYDAVRAYLKELDISSAVWVGLIRSNPEGEFTWTDYRGLSGEGYWSSAPDARAAPLCAAADPAADYRWEARACGGPTVASFICELPVPQWAIGTEGCMVRSLPALTVLYLPESAAVQLTADCGLAGTKRVQCTGNVKREDLLRNLTCADDDDPSSTPTIISTTDSVTSDTTYTDLDAVNEITTETHSTTESQDVTSTTQTPYLPSLQKKQPFKPSENKFKSQYYAKTNVDLIHNNNLQSNDIPKLAHNENFPTLEQTEKLEDEKLLHHKMLHEEIARHGNIETIFTQPTDHFIPPLVMAMAKISDDITEMSLAEKHAQQLAEQRLKYHKNELIGISPTGNKNKSKLYSQTPLVEEMKDAPKKIIQLDKERENEKKDQVKLSVPKKYIEKYESPKGKKGKIIDSKILKFDKIETNNVELPTLQTEKTTETPHNNTTPLIVNDQNKSEEDESIDLTVMLKELGMEDTRASLYTNVSSITHLVQENNVTNATETTQISNVKHTDSFITETTSTNIPMAHEVVEITIFQDNESLNATPIVFEITTRDPEQQSTTEVTNKPLITERTILDTSNINRIESSNWTKTVNIEEETRNATMQVLSENNITSINLGTTSIRKDNITKEQIKSTTHADTKTETSSVSPSTTLVSKINITEETSPHVTEAITEKTDFIIVTKSLNKEHQLNENSTAASEVDVTQKYKEEGFNNTDSTDETNLTNGTEMLDVIDDSNSPLLSGASEPLHRPSRSRRPQQPNRLAKFNPFRILG